MIKATAIWWSGSYKRGKQRDSHSEFHITILLIIDDKNDILSDRSVPDEGNNDEEVLHGENLFTIELTTVTVMLDYLQTQCAHRSVYHR